MDLQTQIFLEGIELIAKRSAAEVWLPRLRKLVSETPTKTDDVVLSALEPLIADALKKDFVKKLGLQVG